MALLHTRNADILWYHFNKMLSISKAVGLTGHPKRSAARLVKKITASGMDDIPENANTKSRGAV
ncbi:hypothetical protein BGZ93_005133 [Podila epicladia]|nr:hypothetical protein BGZ92_007439 [Podila epicladia]KAG0095998.1 hypothetical protein BGZ93_005133 [Podila epicladia]